MLDITVNGRLLKFGIEAVGGLVRKKTSSPVYEVKLRIYPDRELNDYEKEVLGRTEVLKVAIKTEVKNA